MPRNPTPREEHEWSLSGLDPEEAARILEAEIDRIQGYIYRAQIRMGNARYALKAIRANDWPKDEYGKLTLSKDNPIKY